MSERDAGRPHEEVLARMLRAGPGWWAAVGLLGAVVAWAGFAWACQIRSGIGVVGKNQPVFWALYITSFVFWIGLSHSGTLISAILRLTEAGWRHPITRGAEALTVFALAVGAMFPLIHLGRVWLFWYLLPVPNERGLWPNFRSPLVWDAMAITTYLVGSSLFLFLPMVPDLAALRGRVGGLRGALYRWLSLGWSGTSRQWLALEGAARILTVLIIPVAVSVHTIVSWDFAVTLVPTWHSAIFGPYFVVGAIFSGVAAVITCMIVLRTLLGLERYIAPAHLDRLGQILLVMALLWGYLFATEVLTAVLTGDPAEMAVWRLRASGNWAFASGAMVLFNLVLPVAYLSFRTLRRWAPGMLAVSLLVNVGMFIERLFIIVPALSRAGSPFTWGSYRPTWVELSIAAGAFAGFVLLYLLFVKIFPVLPLWEVEAGHAALSTQVEGGKAVCVRDASRPEPGLPDPPIATAGASARDRVAHEARDRLLRPRPQSRVTLWAPVVACVALGYTLLMWPTTVDVDLALPAVLLWALSLGAGSALLLSGLRLVRPHWLAALVRPAELGGLAVVPAVLLFPAGHRVRAGLAPLLPHGGQERWPNFAGEPLPLDLLALALVAVPVLALAITGMRQDLVSPSAREGPHPLTRAIATLLAVPAGLTLLGWDLGMTLVPNWRSTLFGLQLLIGALLVGTAAVLLLAIALRRHPDARPWLAEAQVEPLGTLVLVFSLLWGYTLSAEFLTTWYGHVPAELRGFALRTAGRQPAWFAFVMLADLALPLAFFSVPAWRRRLHAAAAVAALVVAGGLVEKLLWFGPAAELLNTGRDLVSPAGLAVALVVLALLGGLVVVAVQRAPVLSAREVERWLRSRGARRVGGATVVTYLVAEAGDDA